MCKKGWLIAGFIILECSTIWARDILQNPITFLPNQITYLQIVDTLNIRYQLQFSNDASLVTDSLKTFRVDSTITIEGWLNSTFSTDSSEWIQMERQIIIRRKKSVLKSESKIEFKGIILSKEKNEPIPFASITLSKSNQATVANINGEFDLIVNNPVDTMELEISSLGREPFKLKLTHPDRSLLIKLNESVTQLPEVSVSMLNPNTILNKVIENRANNYPNDPTILNGFYRETILQKNHYIGVTEAIITVNKPSYNNEVSSEKVLVEKVRRYKDSINSTVNLRLEGGPFHFSRLDVARNSDFLPIANQVPLYKYFYEGYETEFGKEVYVISFKPIDAEGEFLFTGTLYIDTESYAITSVRFQLSDGAIKKSKNFFVQSEKGDTKTLPISACYQVNYRPWQGKWILSYVRGELKLKITNKRQHLSTIFTAISELAITEANIGKYKILNNGYVKAGDILSEKVSENSQLFWEDSNVIPPLGEVRVLFEGK